MNVQKNYDVVIAGASAAGLYTAKLLAQAGKRVAIFERQVLLGKPGRTLIVTGELLRVLDFAPTDAILHQVDVMEMFAGNQTARVNLREPDLIIERGAMIRRLSDYATQAGAQIHLDHSVQSIDFNNNSIRIQIADELHDETLTVETQTLVGADGARSPIARAMGTRPQITAPIVQARVRLPQGYDPRIVQIWFDRDLTRFFFWLIPDSNEFGVLGLVADSAENARRLLDEFLRRHNYQALSYQGAVIPLHHPRRQIEWARNACRVLLVGDAAAHVKVTTVGGLVSGVWGARSAAESILRGTTYSAKASPLLRELYLHDAMRWLLDRFSNADYAHLLKAINGPLQELLGEHNRDSMARAFWQLVAAQPQLTLLGARAVLFPHGPTAQLSAREKPGLSAEPKQAA